MFASSYDPSHTRQSRVSIEALITRGCFSLTASPVDLSTLTLNSVLSTIYNKTLGSTSLGESEEMSTYMWILCTHSL